MQDGDTPAEGLYDFVFRLWDDSTRGDQIGSDIIVNGVRVTEGQFTVQIDFGARIFNGQALYLEMDVKGDMDTSYETLSPRQLLTGTPLAHSVRPGMTVTNSDSNTSAKLAGTTAGVSGSGGDYGGYFSGENGIYADGVFNDLVLSGAGFFPGVGSISSDPVIADSRLFFISNDSIFMSLDNNNDGDDGQLTLQDDGETVMTVNGSLLKLYGVSGEPRVSLNADDESGSLYLKLPNGFIGLAAQGNETNGGGGKLSLFNSSGLPTVFIDGDQEGGSGGDIVVQNENGEIVGRFRNDANEGGGQFDLRDSLGNEQIVLEAEETNGDGANLIMRNAAGNDTIVLDADKDSGDGGQIMILDSTGDVVAQLHNDTVEGGAELQLRDSAGALRLLLEAEESLNDGAQMILYDSNDNATIILDADYEGTGNGRITTEVLEITGGADLSEQFDIVASVDYPAVTPEPGLVVCIDPKRPGQLVVLLAGV